MRALVERAFEFSAELRCARGRKVQPIKKDRFVLRKK